MSFSVFEVVLTHRAQSKLGYTENGHCDFSLEKEITSQGKKWIQIRIQQGTDDNNLTQHLKMAISSLESRSRSVLPAARTHQSQNWKVTGAFSTHHFYDIVLDCSFAAFAGLLSFKTGRLLSLIVNDEQDIKLVWTNNL